MHASEILRNEHRVIEQVLSCLELMAEQGETSGQIDVTSAEQAIDFLRHFADRCHHGKEEAHFFPAMEAKGFSRHSGPTGVMLQEHEMGRQHVGEMAKAVAAARAQEPAAIRHFTAHARAFVALLREHIQKEDHCLFSIADQVFTPADQQALLDAFTLVEADHAELGTHERCLGIARELADRYRVTNSTGPASGCHTCAGQ